MRILFLSALTILMSGCTTAGPFVSNISSDGRGGLNIEKQKVEYNMLFGVVSTTETTTTNIQLFQTQGAQPVVTPVPVQVIPVAAAPEQKSAPTQNNFK